MAHTPVVIIGAPRSGTNMLRNLLCSADGVATWPCDEINYIWRHGNLKHPSDVFSPEMASSNIQKYIRKQFSWVEKKYDARFVVEKTCANSLRVGFVERVLPEPKYVFVARDGVDAVASAMRRWQAKLDLPYILRKARFVPASDFLHYATRFVRNRLSRLRSADGTLSTWGPVLPEMDSLRSANSIEELCALQWQECVERALNDLEQIPQDRVFKITYEALVCEKIECASRLAQFLNLDPRVLADSPYLKEVSADSIGKGHSNMSANAVSRVVERIESTMKRLGYR